MVKQNWYYGRLHFLNSAVMCMIVCIAVFTSGGCKSPTKDSEEPVEFPKLKIEAPDLSFGESLTEKSFSISNSGKGSLEWSIYVDNRADWCTVSPLEGTGAASVTVRVDRQKLIVPGAYAASITVNSNGGNAKLTVTIITSTGTIIIDTPLPN